MNYYPLVYFNEFWLLREYLVPLNETVSEVTLRLDLYRLAMWKFTLYNQMEESFSMQVGGTFRIPALSQMTYRGQPRLQSP